jgi:hypothetical protein
MQLLKNIKTKIEIDTYRYFPFSIFAKLMTFSLSLSAESIFQYILYIRHTSTINAKELCTKLAIIIIDVYSAKGRTRNVVPTIIPSSLYFLLSIRVKQREGFITSLHILLS